MPELNYQVRLAGQDFPVGAVLPAAAFSHLDWLLSQGAVCATSLGPTMAAPTAFAAIPAGGVEAENARLRQMLGTLPGEAAALRADHDAAVALHDEARSEIADLVAAAEVAAAEIADLRSQLNAARQGQPAK